MKTDSYLQETRAMASILYQVSIPPAKYSVTIQTTRERLWKQQQGYRIAGKFRGGKVFVHGYLQRFAWRPFERQKRAIRGGFLSENRIFFTNPRKLSPSKVSRFAVVGLW